MVPRLDYSLKKFCTFFDRLREKVAPRKTEVWGLVGRAMLSLEYALFLRLDGAAGTFLLDCWARYCHKFLQKQRNLVTSVPSSSPSWNRRYLLKHTKNVTRLHVWCLITRQRSWFKFHGITKGSYNYWKRLIFPCSDNAFHEFHTCTQTNKHNRLALLQGQPRVLCPTRFREQVLLHLQIIQHKDENIISFIKIIPCSRKAQAEKIMKCVRKLRVVFICPWFSTDSI